MRKVLSFLVATFILIPTSLAFAQGVDILQKSDTYTPPFYKGLPIWSYQSGTTFIAVPYGFSNPANLNYRWTMNGTVLGTISGIGRNTLSFTDSILSRTQVVEVEIVSGQGSVLARNSIIATPSAPSLLVYENNPLYGFMFHREVGGAHEIKEKEVTFTSFPLFFGVSSRLSNNLSYRWRTNAGESGSSGSVTYRSPEGTSGLSEVRVEVSNYNHILQKADKEFLVVF